MNDTKPNDPGPGRAGDRRRPVRSASVFIRAAHILAACAVAGGYFLGAPVAHSWWILAGVTGVLLLGAEFLQHRELHREVAGWSTILKLILIGCIPAAPPAAPWLMSAAVILAAVGAHAPKKWRHGRLF